VADEPVPHWKQRTDTLERRLRAVQMRAEGATFDEIGAALGVTKEAARRLILRATSKPLEGQVARLRELWTARHEADWHALDDAAASGDWQAINVRTRIGERVAKLWGLDAPAQSSVTQVQEVKVVFADPDIAGPDAVTDADSE
jgi:hypothetical protein